MKIEKLELRGFKSYHKATELDLADVDICAVVGNNGAGKSSLIDAVLFALYGNIPGQHQAEAINENVKSAEVKLTLRDLQGAQHTFHRTRSSSSSAAAYEGTHGSLEGVTPVTQAALDILNCGLDRLTLTAFSRQGESSKFGTLGDADRREELSAVILGDTFDTDAETAKQVLARDKETLIGHQAHQAQLVVRAKDIEQYEKDVATLSDECDAIAKELQEATNQEAEYGEMRNRYEIVKTLTTQYQRALVSHAEKEERREALDADIGNIQSKLNSANNELELADKDAKKKRDLANKAERAFAVAHAGSEGAEERLTALHKGAGECWTCGRPWDSSVDEIIAGLEELIEADKQASAKQRKASQVAREAANKQDVAQSLVNTLSKRMDALEREFDGLDGEIGSLMEAINETKPALAEAEELKAKLSQCEADTSALDIESLQTKHAKLQRSLGAAQQKLDSALDAQEELENMDDTIKDAEEEVYIARLMREALGPSGMPHLLLERNLTNLTYKTNDLLRAMGELETRFMTYSATKSRPPLSLEARYRQHPTWRNYRTFSGGECMKIDIANRIAMLRIMGVASATLVLDEGWGALDEHATLDLAKLLRSVVNKRVGGIECVYTISHVQAAIEHFDYRIRVEKIAGGSRAFLE